MLLSRLVIATAEALLILAEAGGYAKAPQLAGPNARRLLEPMLQELRRSGILYSATGPHGGYVLARPLDEISLADLLHAETQMAQRTRYGGPRQPNRLEHDMLVALDRVKLSAYVATPTRAVA